uniref:ST8 alpha-N-acetyl-neuraminide alpha-2,8-sialyltransferase 1 n=1 Tax=Sus scrofa TaxID=9823 RepID=A0A8D1FP12_PIG
MSPCGRARRHTSRGAMAVLAWKFPRTRLPVGASALCVVVLCWLYIFPVYRLPNEKEIVQGVLQQGTAWRRNETAARVFRKQMEDCCDPAHLFAMTKMNSPMGKSMWYDGEFLYSFTIDNSTYSLFPQATPFQLPLKKCAVVGNGGILKKSGCGRQIDEANFVMRCNLPPLSSEYTKDVGSKSHLVTANPSIIRQRFQNLLWSRKTFVDNMKIYNHSYIYMPAFSMKTGTEPSLRVYYTLSDVGANQTVLFANPNFLRSIGKFWKSRGIHAKRLSTGLFLNQSSVLHKFKGILFSTMSSEELLNSLDSFDAREDDVFLVSYPKSGKAYFNVLFKCRSTIITIIIHKIVIFIKHLFCSIFPQETKVP